LSSNLKNKLYKNHEFLHKSDQFYVALYTITLIVLGYTRMLFACVFDYRVSVRFCPLSCCSLLLTMSIHSAQALK